jgi:hypothetical protein
MTTTVQKETPKPADLVLALWDALGLDWQPGPLIVYKPGTKSANALKVNMRLQPEWQVAENGNRFLKSISGGLFLDMPAAAGKDGDGNQTWAWQDRDQLLTAKLGRRDILHLRYTIPHYRAGHDVPFVIQPKPTAERPVDPDVARRTIHLFHKNDRSSTIITYCMDPDGSAILQLSKPGMKRSIKLDCFEEFDFLAYLANAHRLFTLTGKR